MPLWPFSAWSHPCSPRPPRTGKAVTHPWSVCEGLFALGKLALELSRERFDSLRNLGPALLNGRLERVEVGALTQELGRRLRTQ